MQTLKRLSASVTMMFALAAFTVAGETSSPPCTPGEVSSPPCTSSMATVNAEGGQMDPGVASAITEATLIALESVLPLF